MPAPVPPLVLLDRDGVINRDSTAYIKSVAEWEPLPGSLEAIARLTRAGFRCVVISNQSGIGRGLFSEATLEAIHARMREAAAAAGGEIAGIYYCPHRPDEGCDCRKPRPGLLLAAARDFGCALAGVPFIGDKISDVEAARAVGARPILVGAQLGGDAEGTDSSGADEADEAIEVNDVTDVTNAIERFPDLAAAADALLAERERGRERAQE